MAVLHAGPPQDGWHVPKHSELEAPFAEVSGTNNSGHSKVPFRGHYVSEHGPTEKRTGGHSLPETKASQTHNNKK